MRDASKVRNSPITDIQRVGFYDTSRSSVNTLYNRSKLLAVWDAVQGDHAARLAASAASIKRLLPDVPIL